MPEAIFTMPSLGADMEHGTLVRWLIKPGQPVKRGQVVAEVETDKGLVDVECFLEGTVQELLAAEGFRGKPGAPLARFSVTGEETNAVGTAGAGAPTATPLSPPPAATVSPPPPEKPAGTPDLRDPSSRNTEGSSAVAGERVRASPYARKRAHELGVDLSTLKPGPLGRINAADVEGAAKAGAKARVKAGAEDPQRAMRRAIGLAMARSKREIPHYYLAHTVDMTAPLAWLRAENGARPVEARLLPAVLLVQAVARACHDVPELNGHWVGDEAVLSRAVHVCFATSLRRNGGLIAPALFDVADKSLDELMRDLTDLVERVRGGKLRGRERTDGTITLTSLGDTGVEELFPVIQPPQLAIVGMGRMLERPWVLDGQLAVRTLLRVTLAADHRASDGASGGRFLRALEKHLLSPSPTTPTQETP